MQVKWQEIEIDAYGQSKRVGNVILADFISSESSKWDGKTMIYTTITDAKVAKEEKAIWVRVSNLNLPEVGPWKENKLCVIHRDRILEWVDQTL